MSAIHTKTQLDLLYEAERERLLAYAAQAGDMTGAFDAPVFGEGASNAPALVLIGEAPGAEETKQGRPFVGKAGQHLSELLCEAKCRREEIYITNVVKYRPMQPGARGPRNRTPTQNEIDASLPLLRNELLLLRPHIIATLGNVPLCAMRTLLQLPPCVIGTVHGVPQQVVQEDGTAVLLYPMYHPASTIYNPALKPVCKRDAAGLGALL